jgi:glycolate oxidase iron-sulfur subunit
MYFCLGCLACMTACPAGVNYAELFEHARAEVERVGACCEPEAEAHPLVHREVAVHGLEPAALPRPAMRLYQQLGLQALLRGAA